MSRQLQQWLLSWSRCTPQETSQVSSKRLAQCSSTRTKHLQEVLCSRTRVNPSTALKRSIWALWCTTPLSLILRAMLQPLTERKCQFSSNTRLEARLTHSNRDIIAWTWPLANQLRASETTIGWIKECRMVSMTVTTPPQVSHRWAIEKIYQWYRTALSQPTPPWSMNSRITNMCQIASTKVQIQICYCEQKLTNN